MIKQNPENSKQKKKVPYNLLLHIHPRKINAATLRFNLTFGLGGMAVLLVVLQFITGLLLRFHYHPSPELAYNSILTLQRNYLFGKMLRNLHHWSAIFLVWITFLHLLRTVFTGAYSKPRHVSWIIGVLLLILVIFANFTGYLLPWDQLSYWAITVSASLLRYVPLIGEILKHTLIGGEDVGSMALTNFYLLHTGVIPIFIFVFMIYHFWRIRRSGGVIVPKNNRNSPKVDVYPHLVAREFVVALVLVAILFFISALFDAPLGGRANLSVSPNPTKAPWYFIGFQEMLIHFHPVIVVFILPVLLMVAFLRLPWFKVEEDNQGVWFLSSKGIHSAIYSSVISFGAAVLFIIASELFPDPEKLVPEISSLITKGLVPLIIIFLPGWLIIKFLKKSIGLNRAEYIQSIIIMLTVAYTVFSIVGIFFRGEGMELVWPWQI